MQIVWIHDHTAHHLQSDLDLQCLHKPLNAGSWLSMLGLPSLIIHVQIKHDISKESIILNNYAKDRRTVVKSTTMLCFGSDGSTGLLLEFGFCVCVCVCINRISFCTVFFFFKYFSLYKVTADLIRVSKIPTERRVRIHQPFSRTLFVFFSKICKLECNTTSDWLNRVV